MQTPNAPQNQALYMPPEHDIFWLSPGLRLPNHEGKLSEYNKRRSDIFSSAGRLSSSTEEQESITSGGRQSAAWEEAWSQLREALEKT